VVSHVKQFVIDVLQGIHDGDKKMNPFSHSIQPVELHLVQLLMNSEHLRHLLESVSRAKSVCGLSCASYPLHSVHLKSPSSKKHLSQKTFNMSHLTQRSLNITDVSELLHTVHLKIEVLFISTNVHLEQSGLINEHCRHSES